MSRRRLSLEGETFGSAGVTNHFSQNVTTSAWRRCTLSVFYKSERVSEKSEALSETVWGCQHCLVGPASLREDSPGQGGAGRGSAPSSPSSGAQGDEGPGPQGAAASVHRDHRPCPVTPVTPLLVPASPPATADTQRGRMEPVRSRRHRSEAGLKTRCSPRVTGHPVTSDLCL